MTIAQANLLGEQLEDTKQPLKRLSQIKTIVSAFFINVEYMKKNYYSQSTQK